MLKADSDITFEDIRRLAVIQEVHGAKRLELPPKLEYTFRHLLDDELLPDTAVEARSEVDRLRDWVERSRILSDPSVTKQSLLDEVAQIATQPDDRFTVEDLRRLALIDALPASHRPDLPDAVNYTLRGPAEERWLPGVDTDSRIEIANLRTWASVQTDEGLALLRERVLRGDTLELGVLAALAGTGESRLLAAGLVADDLLESTFSSLQSGADRGERFTGAELKLAHRILDSLDLTDPSLRTIRDEASTLLRRNVDRAEGNTVGEYDRYVDFAELGRAIASSDLLLQARRAASVTDAAAGAAATSTSAPGSAGAVIGESLLSW